MRICFPTEDDRGLASRVFGHFGSAPYLTIVDTATGTSEVIARGEGGGGHEHGACAPAALLASVGVDAVVCAGMGRRALSALQGAAVYLAAAGPVRDVLADFEAGRLAQLNAAEACAGGDGNCH